MPCIIIIIIIINACWITTRGCNILLYSFLRLYSFWTKTYRSHIFISLNFVIQTTAANGYAVQSRVNVVT
jgi:hypothetical protein